MRWAPALLVAVALMPACRTYEGARGVAAAGGATFGAGLGLWASTAGRDEATLPVTGAIVGAVGMMMIVVASAGMLTLPTRVQVALQLAHALIVRAEAGDCAPVLARHREVQELDLAVYEIVLIEDPDVAACFP